MSAALDWREAPWLPDELVGEESFEDVFGDEVVLGIDDHRVALHLLGTDGDAAAVLAPETAARMHARLGVLLEALRERGLLP